MTFGGWQAAAFVDNLTDTHTVTNYNWTIDPGDGTSRWNANSRSGRGPSA